MHFLEVKNLKKKFLEFELDVSFFAEKNSFSCVLGPSGSGKSTLLKLISGILPLEKSFAQKKSQNSQKDLQNENFPQIILDGADITNAPCAKREIGMVFQSNSLFQNMNVLDNVSYGLRCRGVPKKIARQKAAEFLKKFNLAGFENRGTENLSGGEVQRVALARTLIVRPKLVLFDEPLSALDAPLRKKLAEEILHLQKAFGFAAIMVTHNTEEAKFVAQKIFLMKKGKFVWSGKSAEFSEEFFLKK